jgi:predicted Zn-ribbon and HTH transcriptional regulator
MAKRIKLSGYECYRCGHKWISRSKCLKYKIPVACPKCKNVYWSKPRNITIKKMLKNLIKT